VSKVQLKAFNVYAVKVSILPDGAVNFPPIEASPLVDKVPV
jgi:hypothetical protein